MNGIYKYHIFFFFNFTIDVRAQKITLVTYELMYGCNVRAVRRLINRHVGYRYVGFANDTSQEYI